MPKSKIKKGGGSKLNRTQTVTLRLDPKLRYLTELAARSHHRTTSSFIEWAIETSLSKVELYSDEKHVVMLSDRSSQLWDVDESDRFAKLALIFPNLLLHDEQVMWKIVTENTYFWKNIFQNLTPAISEDSLDKIKLREWWPVLKAIAQGEADVNDLPTDDSVGDKNELNEKIIPF